MTQSLESNIGRRFAAINSALDQVIESLEEVLKYPGLFHSERQYTLAINRALSARDTLKPEITNDATD